MDRGILVYAIDEVMNMKLTQKETTLLKDLKASEELCIEKYGTYAERAEDPELKALFETIRTAELQHLSTIESLMQGTVPMMGGGQQSGEASACCGGCARDALNHIQKEEQEHGKRLYDYMSCHGMCA